MEPKKLNTVFYPGSTQRSKQVPPQEAAQRQKVRPTSKQNVDPPSRARIAAPHQSERIAKPTPQPANLVSAVIGSDGVAVFEDANFDSSVIGYLERGQKVQANPKAIPGKGGFGNFHKITVSGKPVGFVTDVDLVLNQSDLPMEDPTAGPFASGPFSEDEEFKEPSFMSRQIGGFFGTYSYAETVYKNVRRANSHYFYGLKMTGPGTYFDGPPIDSNILFSFTPPSYYDEITEGAPSGFILHWDSLFMMPFIAGQSGTVLFGAGLMAVFTKYNLPIDGVAVDSQELRVGAVLGLSANYAITPKLTLQGDLRYFFEVNNYMGLGFAVVTPY